MKKSSNQANNSVYNSIVSGTRIEGVIHSETNIRIDGELKGKLYCDGKIILGKEGRIEGDIRCEDAVIEGTFVGNMSVNALLDVRASADINGDINTDRISIQAGATYNGHCRMGGQILQGYEGEASTAVPSGKTNE